VSNTNRNLLLAVLALFLLSALTYRQSVGRADRFQRGQMFLSNLNPDEVVTIAVTKGEESVTLKRQGEGFTVVEKQGYPASNSSVNAFLRHLLGIGLEREIGRGEGLAEELEIEPPTEETIEVALQDSTDKEMVRLRIGKAFNNGQGNYIQRLDEEDGFIYLTSGSVFLSSDIGGFLEKEIVDHESTEVQRVEGRDFVLEKPENGDSLLLVDLPANKQAKTSELNRLGSVLSGLRFDEVFVADDPEIQGLEFDQALRLDLTDGSGYELSLATQDERYFMKIRGFNTVQQVAITRDETEEELKEKAEMLTRADEIDDFNSFHGSWVYEISKYAAEKIQLLRSDLIDSEST